MYMDIPVISDEKGYIDRKCPNGNCEFVFKVNAENYKDFSELYCPLCGYNDTQLNNWITDEQYEQAVEIATNFAMQSIQKKLDETFGKLARSTRNNKYLKITYKPGKRISYNNNPIEQREKWALDIQCEKCSTKYSVIGSAYFCPKCGFNNILNNIDESLNSIKNMIESQEEIYKVFVKLYNEDTATTMCQKLLEDSLGDIVSAFQTFAFEIFKTKVSTKKVRANDFQIVDVGNKLFDENIGIKYTDYITNKEMDIMNVYFQRRHLLEHLNGIVDQKYIDKSNDNTYEVGQRIVVKISDVKTLLGIINKLCKGINS